MLTIRRQSMDAFEQSALQRYEDELVEHSRAFAPRLCEVIGGEQLRVAIRGGMKRADRCGFTNRGPIRLYIELMFLFGSHFDTDPQYPMLEQIHDLGGDQMQRAEKLHTEVNDYLEQVSGPENLHVRNALEYLSMFARQRHPFSSGDVAAGLLQEMKQAFPQKAAYVGDEALIRLIEEAQAASKQYGFLSARAEVVLAVMMFAFGHGCTDDPLYPWIARTLNDQRISDSSSRIQRLERKALTWLDHVLARPHQGVKM